VAAMKMGEGYCSTTLTTWLFQKEREQVIDNELTVVLSSIHERMGSPALQTPQYPVLLTPWVCFRGGG
jgi:hypothetical protein